MGEVELPKRKRNRLEGYDYSQNGAYFITICVKDKKPVLGEVCVGVDAHIDPFVQLSSCGRVVDMYMRNIPGIHKYVIMPNHIHMIIMIDDPQNGPMWASAPTQGIQQRIRSFKTMVTKELGKSIFQRSYYDHIIRIQQDYERIWTYIDGNPGKWEEDRLYCI